MFRHPSFHAGGICDLDSIKRKLPGSRAGPTPGDTFVQSAQLEIMRQQIAQLSQQHSDQAAHIRSLESEYDDVVGGIASIQETMSRHDGIMHDMVQHFLSTSETDWLGSTYAR